MSDEVTAQADKSDGESDNRITHASYSIKRPGARIHLNDNDTELDRTRTRVAVGSSPDDIASPPGVALQATLDTGGLKEAYAELTLSPDEARDIAHRLQLAAQACENDTTAWFDSGE